MELGIVVLSTGRMIQVTNMQLKYWENRENERANAERESELRRSHMVSEAETERSNLAKEKETSRSNRVNELIKMGELLNKIISSKEKAGMDGLKLIGTLL